MGILTQGRSGGGALQFLTDYFTHWLEQYGYWVLFFALMLELIALPLPGEFIMTYAGLIAYQGHLNWLLCIVAAGLGSCIGMTISYWIGFRLGTPFFEKYGRRIHFGPDKLNAVSKWYGRYGNKLLLVAYFIPGVRHMTGLFSGIARLSFRKYASFAFTGAIIWVSLFISLGRLLGPKWEQYHHAINRYMIVAGVIAAIVFLCVYLYRKNKHALHEWLVETLKKGYAHYHSMGKVRFVVIAAFALFVSFTMLLIGLIQDFVAQEYAQFDEVTVYVVHRLFDESWNKTMNEAAGIGTDSVFISVIAIACAWIAIKGKDRMLELSVFLLAVIAGKGLNELLRSLFHREGPAGETSGWTYPSGQAMLSLVVFGFAAYLFLRHFGNHAMRLAAGIVIIGVCLALGICIVYSQVQYPSDVAAGYVFGGAWLSLNVILLETMRTAAYSSLK